MVDMKNIRNIAIIAHVDHGKTTLVDAMLAAIRHLSRQRSGRRSRDGFDGPRARARHHDHGQEHVGPIRRLQDQHRRHAGPRGFWRRGRTRFEDGRRHRAAGRCGRRLPAADAFRSAKSAGTQAAGDRARQQDRPAGRAARRGRRTRSTTFSSISVQTTSRSNSRFSTPISRDGVAKKELSDESKNLKPLFDQIIETIPAPHAIRDDSLQLLVANIDYNPFVGRLAIGRIFSGEIAKNQEVAVAKRDGSIAKDARQRAFRFRGTGADDRGERRRRRDRRARGIRRYRDRRDDHDAPTIRNRCR